MHEALAAEIVRNLKKFSDPINDLTAASGRLSDEEGKSLRRHLGTIMIAIEDILQPIVRVYPQLDPDREG